MRIGQRAKVVFKRFEWFVVVFTFAQRCAHFTRKANTHTKTTQKLFARNYLCVRNCISNILCTIIMLRSNRKCAQHTKPISHRQTHKSNRTTPEPSCSETAAVLHFCVTVTLRVRCLAHYARHLGDFKYKTKLTDTLD